MARTVLKAVIKDKRVEEKWSATGVDRRGTSRKSVQRKGGSQIEERGTKKKRG